MYQDTNRMMCLLVSLMLLASSEAFFLKWGSDSSGQTSAQKTWVQPNLSPAIRYQYTYTPYDSRKIYQIQSPQYAQQEIPMHQSMAPIPISIPAGASLTPVSLQHVQLVPCMCPVAPEEAEKLQEQNAGPAVAQTYAQATYPVAQRVGAPQETDMSGNKK